jgi:hypothetical protein
MSRSYKKKAFVGYCGNSDKAWKKQWHSALRSRNKTLLKEETLNQEDETIFYIENELSSIWQSPKDGKSISHFSFTELKKEILSSIRMLKNQPEEFSPMTFGKFHNFSQPIWNAHYFLNEIREKYNLKNLEDILQLPQEKIDKFARSQFIRERRK